MLRIAKKLRPLTKVIRPFKTTPRSFNAESQEKTDQPQVKTDQIPTAGYHHGLGRKVLIGTFVIAASAICVPLAFYFLLAYVFAAWILWVFGDAVYDVVREKNPTIADFIRKLVRNMDDEVVAMERKTNNKEWGK